MGKIAGKQEGRRVQATEINNENRLCNRCNAFSEAFAHVSAIRSLPVVDAVNRWHAGVVAAAGSFVTTRLENSRHKSKQIENIGIQKEGLRNISSKRKSQKRGKGSKGASRTDVLCIEFTRGKRRVYRSFSSLDSHEGKNDASFRRDQKTRNKDYEGFRMVDDVVLGHNRVHDILGNYLLPQGYPDSVAPQYAQYMGWRGVQYFFGGAMSVFTTRSLLGALGVANKHTGEAAAAINWVLKDGAGRFGRFLFARWGRSLDCELKQFRLAGDFLMETGAALELGTALAPRAFLPLACTANLAKNLAAVAASATRAPIYRSFAKQNNMADITAKGESVANLADIAGTLFGIVLSKANLPIVPTFAGLSVGYLIASRREVDSVELPYFNRARLSYSCRKFFDGFRVPDPAEANDCEALLPWNDPGSGRIVLGSSVKVACSGPDHFKSASQTFKSTPYIITYQPEGKKLHVLLKDGIKQEEVINAALDAHTALWMIDPSGRRSKKNDKFGEEPDKNSFISRILKRGELYAQGDPDAVLEWIASNGPKIRKQFLLQSVSEGWRLRDSMLNPSETRLVL